VLQMKLKKITALCLFLLMMSSINVNADQCCATDCCGEWSVHADWLYWNVRKCGLDYAWREESVDGTDTIPDDLGLGGPKKVDPDYESGVRFGFFKKCDEWNFGVRYTCFNDEYKDSFFDAGLNYQASRVLPDTQNGSYGSSPSFVEANFDSARSKYEVDLQVIDIEINRSIQVNCDSNLLVFSGVKLASLDQNLRSEYGNKADFATDRTVVKEKNDMDAYGLYLGGEGTWNVCGCGGLFGRFSVASLLGDVDRSFVQKNVTAGSDFAIADVNDSSWCHVNVLEFAVGFDYELCDFMCADWFLRAGYEFHTWFNMHDFINFCGADIEGHPARQKDSVGFDGLFVRLGAGF